MQQFIKMAGRRIIGVTLMPICYSNIDFRYGLSIRLRDLIGGDQILGGLCVVLVYGCHFAWHFNGFQKVIGSVVNIV